MTRATIRLGLCAALAALAGAIAHVRSVDAPARDPRGLARPWFADESAPERIILTIEIPEPRPLAADAPAAGWEVPGFAERDVVAGAIWPALHLNVALPPAGDYRLRVESEGVRELRPAGARERPAERGFAEDAPADSGLEADDSWRRWQPADELGFVAYRAPRVCAFLRTLPLRVLPVRPSGARFMAPRRLRVIVEWPATPAPDARAFGEAPQAQGARQGLPLSDAAAAGIVNPTQAARWRQPAPRKAPLSGDSFASASSDWLRIEIDRRGVYVLTAQDLVGLGLDPQEIALDHLRLFRGGAAALPESSDASQLPTWMEPCALLIEDDGDDKWDDATRVYFLGNGPDGWRADLGMPPVSTGERYYAHPYARSFTYWLCWDGDFLSAPRRMETVDASPGALPLRESALARVHVERNALLDPRPRMRGVEWQRFYHLAVRNGSLGRVDVALPGVVPAAGAAFHVSLWGATWDLGDSAEDHAAVVAVNGVEVADTLWNRLRQVVARGRTATANASNALTVSVPVRLAGGRVVSDLVYLAWVEADYTRALRAVADSLEFLVSADSAARHALRVTGLSRSDGWLLLDASSPCDPVVLTPSIRASGEGFAADVRVTPLGDEAHLVLLQRAAAAAPARLTREDWHRDPGAPLLRDRTAAIDYLIITSPEFMTAAQTLAAHRRRDYPGPAGDTLGDGRVAVVEIQRVFDEFSWGQSDPVAIRSFVAFAREHWRGDEAVPPLAYLLLLGNAYQDPRGYLGRATLDRVPSHQSYDWGWQLNTQWSPDYFGDDWFTLLDGPNDEAPDISVGRLPAETAIQAAHMVAKIIAYDEDPPPGAWKTRVTLAADDICQGTRSDNLNYTHIRQSEGLSASGAPGNAVQEKIYLYEYGSDCIYDRKPKATTALLETLREGTLLLDFVGHGSGIQLADERLLEKATVPSLANHDKPFLMITASCAVGEFAHGGDGLGLNMIRLEGRGALGVLSASSTASSSYNFNLNLFVLRALFRDETVMRPVAFGPAILAGKLRDGQDNDRRYNLFGDPASRFAAPEHELALRLANVPGVAADSDTLLRGGPATLQGEVVDRRGQRVTDFDGTAEVVVLDSDAIRRPPAAPPADYWLPGARIFSGTVEVSGGVVACDFFVPSALRTGDRGAARIYVYAVKDGGASDASGARAALWIPERVLTSADEEAPELALAWRSAGAVREGSVLGATLQDSSGIYVAALAPSRSVVVTISDAEERTLVANDVAADVVFEGDFRHATLEYVLPGGLPAGEELTLALEASDNLGHRGRAQLVFVLAGASPREDQCLERVYALPNPLETDTRFLLELSEEADVEVTIFTASGRKIREFRLPALGPQQARESGVYWDGRDEDGDRLANGVYLYRVTARGSSGCRGERIERLAVLR